MHKFTDHGGTAGDNAVWSAISM